MPFQRIVDEITSYLVLPEFWIEFWPFAVMLMFLFAAGILRQRHRVASNLCLKTAACLFVLGLLWIVFLL